MFSRLFKWWRGLILIVIPGVLASGCAANFGTPAIVLYKSEEFMIVQAGSADTYATLAERYMGAEDQQYIIRAVNASVPDKPGKAILSIPLNTLNAASVFPDGYQLVPILCYHQFVDASVSRSAMQVSARAFERQMEYLANNGYHVIPFSRLQGYLSGKQPVPPKSVVITIDDGYKSVFETAFPILKKFGFNATLFLYTDFVGGGAALSWNSIRAMQATGLIDVESHSSTHTSLVQLPKETTQQYGLRIAYEVVNAEKVIQRSLNRKTRYYAYPFGDTSELVMDTLRINDYPLAATVQRGSNAAFTSPLLLRRNMIYASDDIKKFASQLKVFHTVNLK
ncbi:MAG: polysaccharide deacetylase family protein [Pseudomonadales bacterium]|nr:polysaccharide deacetylase family protein [Pseudomonadales bacterium]